MYLEDLAIGQTATIERTVTQEVIQGFADVSQDHNPLHLDAEFARTTDFEGVIAHGMLSAAYISAVLGTQLPGSGTIYMGQTLRFRAPVRPGDKVVTTVAVKEIIAEKKRVILDTVCTVGDIIVLEGEATTMVRQRPAA